MAKAYTKAEILMKFQSATNVVSSLYKEDFVNYRGRTSDTKEYYTELIAQQLLLDWIEPMIPKITRKKT